MSIASLNPRNQFTGSVSEITIGPVLSEVEVETAAGTVTSVVTTRAIRELQLEVGSLVIAFVKATDVALAKLE